MIRRPPRSTQSRSSAASDVYKRQVDLARVLAREGAAAVRCGAAVRVHDDLAAREAAVAHRAADDELAGGVDDGDVFELGGVVEPLGQDGLDDVFEEVRIDDALQIGALGVLGGEHDLCLLYTSP